MESKVEKLAQARKKLLNYQKKQQKSRTETSSPLPVISNMDAGNSTAAGSQQAPSSFNHDEKRSPFEWLHHPLQERDLPGGSELYTQSSTVSEIVTTAKNENINCAGDNEVSSNTHQNASKEKDLNVVSAALEEALCEKEKLSAQLIELHQHYSEIYTAYNALVNTVQNGSDSDLEIQTQLAQLRTAMSVIVEEKTALQQQLREANEIAKKRYDDVELLNKTIHDKTLYTGKLEQELNEVKAERDRFNTALQRQKEELENNRRELISLQANILHLQQDRNDVQGRFKLSVKSNEQLQAELDETQKQLRMKELYIRQLGAYSTSIAVNEQGIKNLHTENERLNAELLKAQSDVDRYRKEALAAREHYEVYEGQLNQKVLTLSNQVSLIIIDQRLLQLS
uniref:GOLGA2L5 domain-containing protein n=1 Tax=Syphacia muris TaxID=451379 RepID=A0A0N5AX03_9BILA